MGIGSENRAHLEIRSLLEPGMESLEKWYGIQILRVTRDG